MPDPPRFPMGRVVATPAALAALRAAGDTPQRLLARHERGDFGDLDPSDVREQLLALSQEHDPDQRQRLMSAYRLVDGTVVWVITEADRSSTCILLPDEY